MTRVLAAMVVLAACGSTSKSTPEKPTPVEPAEITADEIASASIASIEIEGLKRIPRSEVRLVLRSHPGAPIQRHVLRQDLRRIMRIRGVADVRVEAVRVGEGIGLSYVVTEAARIAGVQMDGNTALTDDELSRDAELEVGGPVDPLEVGAGASAIRRHYRLRGYYRAAVSWKTTDPGDGALVVYSVDEGPRVSIDSISFPGAKSVKEAELQKLLTGQTGWNAVGSVYVDEEMDAGVLRITSEYYDRGYINLKFEQPVVRDIADDKLELVVPIDEGPQFRLGKISVIGQLAAPEADYMGLVNSRTGDVFNRTKLQADIQALAAFQRKTTGNQLEVVTPLTDVDIDKHVIDIEFEIHR